MVRPDSPTRKKRWPWWLVCLAIAVIVVIGVVIFATLSNPVLRMLLVLGVVVFALAMLLNPLHRYARMASLLTGAIIGSAISPTIPLVISCESTAGKIVQSIFACPETGAFDLTFPNTPVVAYLVMGGLAALLFWLDFRLRLRLLEIDYGDRERRERIQVDPTTLKVKIRKEAHPLRSVQKDNANGEDGT